MATAATGCWADLNSELVVSIATAADNGLSLKDYVCLRGVCTAWRSALVPPYPCLLSLTNDRASVFSLPMGRSFHLCTASYSMLDDESRNMGIRSRVHVVGSGNNRFAVAIDYSEPYVAVWGLSGVSCWTEKIVIVGPSTGEEVKILPPGKQRCERVHKIVFAPSSTDDGTVVAMSDNNKVPYIDTTSSRGDMKWTAVDFQSGNAEHLVDLVLDDAGGKVYCLGSSGGVRVLHIPRGVRNEQDEPVAVAVEHSLTLLPSPSATLFAPPYNIAFAKHLFLCHGSLYQMWQNTSATVRSGDGSTMSADEIFVLRYNNRGRRPYGWDKVKDLGGCSVFVGKRNNTVVAGAGAVPGVQAECVYWIDWRRVPMVCDMATGTSKPCVLPYGTGMGNCWYLEVVTT